MNILERKNLYTIGCHIPKEIGRDAKEMDGIYVHGKYGLPFIAYDRNNLKEEGKGISLYVIEGADEAQKVVQYLARCYRYEFRHRVDKYHTDISDYKFYAIRLTKDCFNNIQFDSDNAKPMRQREKYIGNRNKVKIVPIVPL